MHRLWIVYFSYAWNNSDVVVCKVHGNEFYFEAINFDDCSEAHPPVYFHVSPMEGGQIPVPWGYFSFDPMSVDDGKDILMRPSHWPEGTDDYESVLPGVVAFVRYGLHFKLAPV